VTRLICVDELRPGDTIRMPRCEPVVVEELVDFDDGRVGVNWWWPTSEKHRNRRRYFWKHPRGKDGEPLPVRLSLGALRAINARSTAASSARSLHAGAASSFAWSHERRRS
jgi:hypothetical protein